MNSNKADARNQTQYQETSSEVYKLTLIKIISFLYSKKKLQNGWQSNTSDLNMLIITVLGKFLHNILSKLG